MKKKILAILGGIIASVFTVMACEYVNHIFYPPPAGLEGVDWETIQKIYIEYVKVIPLGALISLWLGWMVGALVGGFVSGKIDTINWKFNSYILAGILLLFAILNMFMIPHPIWMISITVLGYYPAVYLGSKLATCK